MLWDWSKETDPRGAAWPQKAPRRMEFTFTTLSYISVDTSYNGEISRKKTVHKSFRKLYCGYSSYQMSPRTEWYMHLYQGYDCVKKLTVDVEFCYKSNKICAITQSISLRCKYIFCNNIWASLNQDTFIWVVDNMTLLQNTIY